jgi:hypothetical protein
MIVRITHRERRAQRLHVSFVHFIDARERSTKERIVVLIHTLLDEIRWLVLELLECRDVLPSFFVAAEVSYSLQIKRVVNCIPPSNDDSNVIDDADLHKLS